MLTFVTMEGFSPHSCSFSSKCFELFVDSCKGAETCCPGSLIGHLTAEAAEDLGLKQGTAVGGSLIDAHAGGLGTPPHILHGAKKQFTCLK